MLTSTSLEIIASFSTIAKSLGTRLDQYCISIGAVLLAYNATHVCNTISHTHTFCSGENLRIDHLTSARQTLQPTQTYVFIVGTYGLPVDRVDVLQGPCGEAHDEVELGRASGERVEIVADRHSRGLVHPLVNGPFQIWDLDTNEVGSAYCSNAVDRTIPSMLWLGNVGVAWTGSVEALTE